MTRADVPYAIVPNLGGPIDPDHHIGHVRELANLHRATFGVGALVLGDRRMGKTSLLRRLQHEMGTAHAVISLSAETSDIELFSQRLLNELRGVDHLRAEIDRWDLVVDVSYRGIRVTRRGGSADPPGPDPTSDDLFVWAARHALPGRLIIIIDEVSVLVGAIEQQHSGGGVEFLRSLRRPRQEHAEVAVILSGSIGLHHVVDDMTPVNDLERVTVAALTPDDAQFLARCLLLGDETPCDDEAAVAAAIADASDGVAYYVHHLVVAAGRLGRRACANDVPALRAAAITDPDDPWNLRHYRDRLPTYYGDDAPLVRLLLDVYACERQPTSVDAAREQLAATVADAPPDRDRLISLIERLENDYYLARVDDANTMSSSILRDAWRHLRRLS